MVYKDINPNEIKNNDIIIYHVPWCGHCIKFESTFSQLQNEFNKLKNNFRVVSVNVEQYPNIDIKFTGGKKILSVPKLVVMRNGFSCEYKKRFINMSAPDIAKDLSGGSCGLSGGEVSSQPVIAGGEVAPVISGGELEGGAKKKHRKSAKRSRSMTRKSKKRSTKRRSPMKYRMMGGGETIEGGADAALEGGKRRRHYMRGGADAAVIEGGADAAVIEGGAADDALEGGKRRRHHMRGGELEGGVDALEGGKKKRSKSPRKSRSRSRSPKALAKWRRAIKATLPEYKIPRKGTSAYRKVKAAYDRM